MEYASWVSSNLKEIHEVMGWDVPAEDKRFVRGAISEKTSVHKCLEILLCSESMKKPWINIGKRVRREGFERRVFEVERGVWFMVNREGIGQALFRWRSMSRKKQGLSILHVDKNYGENENYYNNLDLVVYAVFWASIVKAKNNKLIKRKITKKERREGLSSIISSLELLSKEIQDLHGRIDLYHVLEGSKGTYFKALNAIGEAAKGVGKVIGDPVCMDDPMKKELKKYLDKIGQSFAILNVLPSTDIFEALLVPYLRFLQEKYESVGALSRPRGGNVFRNVLAACLVSNFKCYFDLPLKDNAAITVAVLFGDDSFDKKKLDEAVRPVLPIL